MSMVFNKNSFNDFVNTNCSHAKNSFKNSYGFTVPVVVLFVLAFMIIPLGFWLSEPKHITSGDVQGAESAGFKEGTHLIVVSNSGSWDLFEYLCKTKEECEKSLTSGKKIESVSGGKTEGSSVSLTYSDTWKDYEFVKIYAKQGWGSNGYGNFDITKKQVDGFGEVTLLEKQTVLLIPVKEIQSGTYGLFEIKSSL